MSDQLKQNLTSSIKTQDIDRILANVCPDYQDYPVLVLAIRGHYSKTFGKAGNDIGVYDDLILIYAKGQAQWVGQGNTDPSAIKRATATVQPGKYRFRAGKHHWNSPTGYAAFRGGTVKFTRPNLEGIQSGAIGINLHQGGNYVTGSEGCQTIPPYSWRTFRDILLNLLGVTVRDCLANPLGVGPDFPYILVDRKTVEHLYSETMK